MYKSTIEEVVWNLIYIMKTSEESGDIYSQMTTNSQFQYWIEQ